MCDNEIFRIRIEKINVFTGTESEIFGMLVSRYLLQKGEAAPFFIGRPAAA